MATIHQMQELNQTLSSARFEKNERGGYNVYFGDQKTPTEQRSAMSDTEKRSQDIEEYCKQVHAMPGKTPEQMKRWRNKLDVMEEAYLSGGVHPIESEIHLSIFGK